MVHDVDRVDTLFDYVVDGGAGGAFSASADKLCVIRPEPGDSHARVQCLGDEPFVICTYVCREGYYLPRGQLLTIVCREYPEANAEDRIYRWSGSKPDACKSEP